MLASSSRVFLRAALLLPRTSGRNHRLATQASELRGQASAVYRLGPSSSCNFTSFSSSKREASRDSSKSRTATRSDSRTSAKLPDTGGVDDAPMQKKIDNITMSIRNSKPDRTATGSVLEPSSMIRSPNYVNSLHVKVQYIDGDEIEDGNPVISSHAAIDDDHNHLQKSSKSKPALQSHGFPCFELTFLGSGGSSCSKHRGSPASVLALGNEKWLFDCGEGTTRQALFFESITSIDRIFVTHMHADHIFGLPGLILHWASGSTIPSAQYKASKLEQPKVLNIYGPPGLHAFIVSALHFSAAKTYLKVIVHELALNEQVASNGFSWSNGWRQYTHADGEHSIKSSSSSSSSNSNSSSRNGSNSNSSSRNRNRSSNDDDDDHRHDQSNIIKKSIAPDANGVWTCFADKRISVKCGLIHHKIPCFGFAVQETDVAGTLDLEKCQADGVPVSYFKLIKEGRDFITADGREIRCVDYLLGSQKGRKLCLLGDTNNARTPSMLEIAKDCDLLVHEVTFPENSNVKVNIRGHSTPYNAAACMRFLNARRLAINHIGAQFVIANFELSRDGKAYSDFSLLQDTKRHVKDRAANIHLARDFTSISIPIGGYSLDNSDIIKTDRSGLDDRGSNFKDRQFGSTSSNTTNSGNSSNSSGSYSSNSKSNKVRNEDKDSPMSPRGGGDKVVDEEKNIRSSSSRNSRNSHPSDDKDVATSAAMSRAVASLSPPAATPKGRRHMPF